MKRKQRFLASSLLVILSLSASVVGPVNSPFGAYVASAATSTSIERLLAKGSVGEDVKLLQMMLNDNGFNLKVDGIFGKLTLNAVNNFQSKSKIKVDGIVGPKTLAKLNSFEAVAGKVALKVGRADYAAHGTKSFANVVVAMAGDKIVAVSLEEYQFMAKSTTIGVPNSDKDFGANYKNSDTVLGSKLANAATYSKNMAEKAGSTVAIDKNFNFIEEYVTGKTISELEKTLSSNTKEAMVDVVTGATLVDTDGYIRAIVEAAKLAKSNPAFQIDKAAINNVKIGRADYAAHGTKCFTNAVTVMVGDKIVAASLDDYQFMNKATSVGVPNSDKDFGANYGNPETVLASKLANAAAYSANMAKAGSTVAIDQNLSFIESYTAGKTVAELEKTLSSNTKEAMVDVVTGATLVDTDGYVRTIIEAAKLAK